MRREGLAAPLDLPVGALADEKCVERERAQEKTYLLWFLESIGNLHGGLNLRNDSGKIFDNCADRVKGAPLVVSCVRSK